MKKLDKNTLFIAFLFLATRLPALGKDIINVDAPAWDYRATQFYAYLKNFNFAETYRTYHPGVTLMWVSGFGIEVYNQIYKLINGVRAPYYYYSLFPYLHFSQKFPLVIVGLTLIILCFGRLKNLVGEEVALLFITFFVLEPFVVANTRVLHLDGLMLLFMLASILFLLEYLINSKPLRFLIFSGAFASLAILTKVSAVFVVLFDMLLIFIFRFNFKLKWEIVRRLLRDIILFLLSLSVVALIIFPAMWVSPVNVVHKIVVDGILKTGYGGQPQTFFGRQSNNPGMLFYIYTLAFRLSPIALITLPLSFFLLVRRLAGNPAKFVKENKIVLIFTLFGILYFVQMALASKKIDRYVLPVVMSVCFFVVLGIYDLIKKWTRLAIALLIIQFFLLSYQIFPDYFNYANPAIGGLRASLETFGPMDWGAGYYKVADFLNRYPRTTGDSRLAAFNDESIRPYFKGRVVQIDVADFPDMQYVVLPPTNEYRYEMSKNFRLVKTVGYGSVDYWYIYENKDASKR